MLLMSDTGQRYDERVAVGKGGSADGDGSRMVEVETLVFAEDFASYIRAYIGNCASAYWDIRKPKLSV